jgi:WD40 repeat protein
MLRGHTGAVNVVAFAPDGKTLASASTDGTVKLWPANGALDQDVIAEDDDWVYTVAFSPSNMLASGCYDGTVRLCDAQTLETIEVFESHEYQVSMVDFSPSGQWLASCESVKRVNARWNYAEPGQVILTNVGDHGEQVFVPEVATGIEVAQFSPDGRKIAIGDRDGLLKLWDVDDRRFTLSVATGAGTIQNARFAPDGKTLATVHGQRGPVAKPPVVKLWDLATRGDPLATFEKTTGRGVAFSPDGKVLATGSDDHSIKLWDVGTKRELIKLPGHKAYVMDIRFSPDGQTLATCSMDHTIKLWSFESGQGVATLKGHSGPVSGLAFSHDGTVLASSSADKTVRLWRAPHIKQTNE